MYCKYCGKEIANDVKFCPACGSSQEQNPQQPVINIINSAPAEPSLGVSQKNKWVAFLLCLFLGGIGIHRFYVGKIGTGILWLFTLGLFGIGSIIDLIVIICGGFTDKSGNKLI